MEEQSRRGLPKSREISSGYSKTKILNKRRKKKKQVYNKSMSDFKSNRALLVSGFTCFSLVGNSNTFINGQYPGRDEVLDGT